MASALGKGSWNSRESDQGRLHVVWRRGAAGLLADEERRLFRRPQPALDSCVRHQSCPPRAKSQRLNIQVPKATRLCKRSAGARGRSQCSWCSSFNNFRPDMVTSDWRSCAISQLRLLDTFPCSMPQSRPQAGRTVINLLQESQTSCRSHQLLKLPAQS